MAEDIRQERTAIPVPRLIGVAPIDVALALVLQGVIGDLRARGTYASSGTGPSGRGTHIRQGLGKVGLRTSRTSRRRDALPREDSLDGITRPFHVGPPVVHPEPREVAADDDEGRRDQRHIADRSINLRLGHHATFATAPATFMAGSLTIQPMPIATRRPPRAIQPRERQKVMSLREFHATARTDPTSD